LISLKSFEAAIGNKLLSDYSISDIENYKQAFLVYYATLEPESADHPWGDRIMSGRCLDAMPSSF
jgi:hypothetical protein